MVHLLKELRLENDLIVPLISDFFRMTIPNLNIILRFLLSGIQLLGSCPTSHQAMNVLVDFNVPRKL